MAKISLTHEFTKGILKENPVLCLLLGTCPTLAVTAGAMNAIGMGIAATLVLAASNAAISLLRRIIPDSVRIPAYITLIAGFVTIAQLIIKAYLPAIDESLGVFLPLIVVNCIILGRAEMFANKNSVLPSVLDGLGMGIGFTATLLCMGIIRELLGTGKVLGMTLLPESVFIPITIFILPAGGFFVFGMLIALANKLQKGRLSGKDFGCGNCVMASSCLKRGKEKETCKEGAEAL